MCTVNIKVDDALMRRINQELTSPDRINQWLQNQVDELIGRMTSHHLSPNCTFSRIDALNSVGQDTPCGGRRRRIYAE